MSAAAIIGNVVIFGSVFRDHVHEEQESSALTDLNVGCIDAVEFMPAGSCEFMELRFSSFACQSIVRRDRLS